MKVELALSVEACIFIDFARSEASLTNGYSAASDHDYNAKGIYEGNTILSHIYIAYSNTSAGRDAMFSSSIMFIKAHNFATDILFVSQSTSLFTLEETHAHQEDRRSVVLVDYISEGMHASF